MSSLSAKTPVRADHRFLKKLMAITVPKAITIPSELDFVSRVFLRLGGSWERVFKGSVKDIDLLRRILKKALKEEFLTKRENWTGANGQKRSKQRGGTETAL